MKPALKNFTYRGTSLVSYYFYVLIGGEGGIRTLDGLSPIHTFQACSLNRSDTSPRRLDSSARNGGDRTHHTSAHEGAATVAPSRAWRS